MNGQPMFHEEHLRTMSEPQTPWFTDAEIDDLTAPLKQPAAQIRYLRGLGLAVAKKPSGRALLLRSEAERVLGSAAVGDQAHNRPTDSSANVVGLQAWASGRRNHGKKPKGR